MKCGMILMACPLVFGSLVYADRPDFNDKEAPQTLGDFREIQNALQSHLARTRSADSLSANGVAVQEAR